MTPAIRRLALAERIPLDLPPSEIIGAVTLRRRIQRREAVAMASANFNAMAVAMGEGSVDDILRPFYSRRELDALNERREQERQEAAQRAQIAKLMRWGKMNHD